VLDLLIYVPVVAGMNIPHAISLLREACALRHFSFKTEQTYTYWVGRYGAFLHNNRLTAATTEQKNGNLSHTVSQRGCCGHARRMEFERRLKSSCHRSSCQLSVAFVSAGGRDKVSPQLPPKESLIRHAKIRSMNYFLHGQRLSKCPCYDSPKNETEGPRQPSPRRGSSRSPGGGRAALSPDENCLKSSQFKVNQGIRKIFRSPELLLQPARSLAL
jgi:hypothetical protein